MSKEKSVKKQREALCEDLLEAQFELQKANLGPVLLLVSGNDLAGKAELIYTFYDWLDNRYLNTRAFTLPQGVERKMPRLWRYWRSLPPAGTLGFYLGSWYHQPLIRLSRGQLSEKHFTAEMAQITRFENQLVAEGVGLLKLWLHLDDDHTQNYPPHQQQQQYDSLAMREWGEFSTTEYSAVRQAADRMSELTSSAIAPWIRVPSSDPDQRDLQVGRLLLQAMEHQLQGKGLRPDQRDWQPSKHDRLAELDYDCALKKDVYKRELAHYQQQLRDLIRHPAFAKGSLLLVFEGADAAGKGGTIRRITRCLDPRILRVHGTRAPTDEERSQPYLLRFWRRIPAPGRVVVFDRSYYGRVLVERVEGFCSELRWQQAYAEINDFEAQLHKAGTQVIKFWLAITPQEQLSRFEAREKTPTKRYKLTDEDWRNREKWPDYVNAMNDMVENTATAHAPWHVIPATDKRYARIQALRIVCETLQKRLKQS
ncbi:polyphosphate:AMP phosphotransferase [Halopseudomonas sabulinigri]|uniref:Polyphosphate:AMP phosphotransferase n=1 Tax=Halopseudomonas sabulinigri TaxID=472181 RepID=A0ABP9ZND2_9GAMM